MLLCLPFCLFGCEKEEKLNFYKIDVVFDEEKKALLCSQEINFVNSSDNALDEVDFFLYANSFAEGQKTVDSATSERAYPNGKSYGNIDFEQISINEKEVEFSFEEPNKNILIVPLEKELFPNEEVTISMSYTVNLANIHHRLGYGENTINCGSFFPIACVYENGFIKKIGRAHV